MKTKVTKILFLLLILVPTLLLTFNAQADLILPGQTGPVPGQRRAYPGNDPLVPTLPGEVKGEQSFFEKIWPLSEISNSADGANRDSRTALLIAGAAIIVGIIGALVTLFKSRKE